MSGKQSYELEELNRLADLPMIVNDLYPDARARPNIGGNCFAVWRGNKNTPSFNLNNKKGTWLWYDSGNTDLTESENGGNAYQFLRVICKYDHNAAYAYLLDHLNLTDGSLQPLDNEKLGKYAKLYKAKLAEESTHPQELERRGITAATAKHHSIISDQTGLIFPIYNQYGDAYDFKKRFFEVGEGQSRYIFLEAKDRKHISQHVKPLSGEKFLEHLGKKETILIIEGELNSYVAQQALGDDFIYIALTGKACHVYYELVEDKNVLIYTDDMETSKRIASKAIEFNPDTVGILPLIEEGQDYCDLGGKMTPEELQAYIYGQITDTQSIFSALEKKVGIYSVNEHLKATASRMSGRIIYPTGFIELDNEMNGLEPSGITVIAALSGYGKSTLLRQIIDSIITFTNERVRVYTPDQSSINLMLLMAVYRAKVNMAYLKSDNLPLVGQEAQRFKSVQDLRDYFSEVHQDTLINYSKRLQVVETLKGVESRGDAMVEDMRKAADKGVKVFGIDYIQFYSLYGKHEGDTMVALKDFCREYGVQILVAAQLAKTKFGHDRPSNLGGIPISTDIEGRGATYQLADQVLAVYNQDKYMREFGFDTGSYAEVYDPNDLGKARIYVLKHKMGNAGYYKLVDWIGDKVMFRCQLGGRSNIHDSYLEF